MSKKAKKILWETTDYKERIVILDTDALYHAIKGHPEIADLEEEIKKTIEEPNMVVESINYNDTEVHGRYGIGTGHYATFWLHVPVLYQVGGIGDVRTVYTSRATKPGKILYVNIKL